MIHRNKIKQKNTFCVYCVHGSVFIAKYKPRINKKNRKYIKNIPVSLVFPFFPILSPSEASLDLRQFYDCVPPPPLISLFWRVAALLFSDVHQWGYFKTLGLFASYHPETHVIADILFSSQKMLLKKNCGGKTRTIKIRVSEIRFNLSFPTLDGNTCRIS